MICMDARQGRELQRYTSTGGRLVVGCIPYKLRDDKQFVADMEESLQVLVITSQKGHGMMFPKGGWEIDEDIKAAVSREAFEEAGVKGDVKTHLGQWRYKSRRYDQIYEGDMFSLNVTTELLQWPEMAVRKRKWVTVAEAREGCQHLWMREALERLISHLANS